MSDYGNVLYAMVWEPKMDAWIQYTLKGLQPDKPMGIFKIKTVREI